MVSNVKGIFAILGRLGIVPPILFPSHDHGVIGGGQTNDIARGTFVEVYAFDGTNWTETGDLNTGRGIAPFFGTQTASILASGQTDTASVANVEEFNGTSWTEIAEVNTVRQEHAAAGSVSTDAIIFAGSPTKANRS